MERPVTPLMRTKAPTTEYYTTTDVNARYSTDELLGLIRKDITIIGDPDKSDMTIEQFIQVTTEVLNAVHELDKALLSGQRLPLSWQPTYLQSNCMN